MFDLACLEIGARVVRLSGDTEHAQAVIADGLERSAPYPMIHAMMQLEAARVSNALHRPDDAARQRDTANTIFRANGLAARVEEGAVAEYASRFQDACDG